MKKLDWLQILYYSVCAALVLIFACSLFSCSVFKSKHSEYKRTDSSTVKTENKTTEVKTDSFAVRKSQTEEENSVVFDFRDRGMVVIPNDSNYSDKGIYITPTDPKDYFYWDGSTLLTNIIPKKVTIKGKRQEIKLDSQAKDIDFIEDHSKLEKTDVTNIVKKSDKVKRSFNALWLLWLLLIPVGYFIYKHRHKIMAFYPF